MFMIALAVAAWYAIEDLCAVDHMHTVTGTVLSMFVSPLIIVNNRADRVVGLAMAYAYL